MAPLGLSAVSVSVMLRRQDGLLYGGLKVQKVPKDRGAERRNLGWREKTFGCREKQFGVTREEIDGDERRNWG